MATRAFHKEVERALANRNSPKMLEIQKDFERFKETGTVEPKLLRTVNAEYIPAPFLGENRSGWLPIGDYVLVKPDLIARQSSGGIQLPDDIAERLQLAATTGVIVECGDEAFKWNADRTRPFEGRKPQPGDRVIFEKYAGKPILGTDGCDYRILDDKCVGGIQRKS